MFSVMRIAIAYVISLVFSIVYGYVAAYNAKAERLMIPLLDTLQSIPGVELSSRGDAGYGGAVSEGSNLA